MSEWQSFVSHSTNNFEYFFVDQTPFCQEAPHYVVICFFNVQVNRLIYKRKETAAMDQGVSLCTGLMNTAFDAGLFEVTENERNRKSRRENLIWYLHLSSAWAGMLSVIEFHSH